MPRFDPPRPVVRLLSLLLLLPAPLAGQPSAGVEAPPAATGAVAAADHPRVREALHLLDVWAEAQLAYELVPGASLAVVDDQELLFAGGYGFAHPHDQVPADGETLYSICSISKLFTSIAVMQQWEEGRLELDDPVADHLGWFDLRETHDGLPITVQGLLTHSSGLPRESGFPYWSPPDFDFPSRDEIRRRLAEQATLYPAERYFQYSNLGLTLAGETVTAITGTPYGDYVTSRILEPLGLGRTTPAIPVEEEGGRLATGHSALGREGVRERLPLFRAEGIAPAAGFASSVVDLGRFASWQFRLLESDAAEVLAPATLRKMHRVHWVDPDWDVHWGLGFGVSRSDGATYVGHGGSCPGYRSSLSLRPDRKVAAAFAANASGVDAALFTRTAHRIVGPALQAAGDTAAAPEATPAELERFSGRYSVFPWGGEIAVVPWKGSLAMVGLPTEDPMEALQELKHVEGARFRRKRDDGELGEPIEFEIDASGEVRALLRHGNRWERMPDAERP